MATPPASPPPPPPSPPPSLAVASASPSTLTRTRKRPVVVHIDPTIDKADNLHKKKLRTYLGIITRDKVDMTYETCKEVPATQKNLIWEDIQVEFEIPEASDSRTKKKVLQTVGNRHLQSTRTVWTTLFVKNTTLARRNGPSFVKPAEIPRRRCAEKSTSHPKQNTAPHSGSTEGVINPPSPIRRHVKWKMARTKKTGHMTSKAAKEIVEKIDSLEEQASQGSFIPHGQHPGRVRAAKVGVTIKQYFGSTPRSSRSSSSILPEELEQLTQQIKDQLEDPSFNQMQSEGIALPPEPEVGPSATRVSTKGNCVDPSPTDPKMGDLDKCGLYIEENSSQLVALGRVYEGSITVHNIPLLHGQVRVGVEEVKDAEAPVPVPTDEVILVGQTLNTFLAWPTHLAVVSPAKPVDRVHPEVNDLLYLMTLVIPQLFLRPLQVFLMTLIKTSHCTSSMKISLKLHTMVNVSAYLFYSCRFYKHLTETSMRARNFDFESESYMKSWMQSSKRDVYLGAYLNGSDNYLKGIINRQKGSTECDYYVMHWMSTIILGTFKNNWETYFNDVRPLEVERLKALRIQWTQFYLKVTNQS
ncbi:hypothetical protein HKD37_14G040100 [Glycine soja]